MSDQPTCRVRQKVGTQLRQNNDFSITTGVDCPEAQALAARLGFRLRHNYNDHTCGGSARIGEKFVLNRDDVNLDFNTLPEAVCFLKGIECQIVLDSVFGD